MKCILVFALSAASLAAAEPALTPKLELKLRTIATEYTKGELVNPAPLVAPTQCFLPPTSILYSKAKAKSKHAGKLYYLFAKERQPLAHKEQVKGQPIGQYLVKESWEAIAPSADTKQSSRRKGSRFVSNTVVRKGKTLTTGKPADLFIMLKQYWDTPNTDQGWTYAVVSRDAKTIKSAGKIESCISCHEDAEHDRILGDYTRKLWPPHETGESLKPAKSQKR